MKKFLFLQILFIFSLTISCEPTSYGASDFSKHYSKGIEFYKQGKYDQAGKAFEDAIKIKPNDVYALYGLGNTHYCKAKYGEAVKVYMRAININPDYAKVHYSLSLAYSKLGKTSEAEKEKAIFRQLSQGGKSGKRTKTNVRSSRSTKRGGKTGQVKRAPKKTLTKTKPERRAPTRTTSKQQKTTTEERGAKETRKSPATSTRRSTKKDDSHSIFKGYTGETQKTDKRAFSKKYKEKYGISTGPFDNIKLYIQEKWYSSRLNKIWICIAGYVLATQIWLCAVTFFVLIIWRIREKT